MTAKATLQVKTKSISEVSNPKNLKEHKIVTKRGGNIAKKVRKKLEKEIGRKAISSLNAKTGILVK